MVKKGGREGYQQLPKWECVNLPCLLDDTSSFCSLEKDEPDSILSLPVCADISQNSLTIRGDADDSVTCGLWLGRHDAQLLANDGIDQSGLARIGLRRFTGETMKDIKAIES